MNEKTMPAKRKDTSQLHEHQAIRVTVQLSGAQVVALDRVAARDRMNLSSVIRKAVERMLEGESVDEAGFENEVAFRRWLVTRKLPRGASPELQQEFKARARKLPAARDYSDSAAVDAGVPADSREDLIVAITQSKATLAQLLKVETRLLKKLDARPAPPAVDADTVTEITDRIMDGLRARLQAHKKEGVVQALKRTAKTSSERDVERRLKESVSAALQAAM
jgi:hypothetical protein